MTAGCVKSLHTGMPIKEETLVDQLGVYYQDYEPYRQSAAFRTAARLVRFHSAPYLRLLRCLSGAGASPNDNDYIINGTRTVPFAVPVLEMENGAPVLYVYKYENISLEHGYVWSDDWGNPRGHCISLVSWFSSVDVLSHLVRLINKEKKDPIKGKKWETPSREIKQMKRRTKMTIFKYLKFLHPHARDSELQKIGENITSDFLPIEVKWCKTLKDWEDMYEKAGNQGKASSCMVSTSDYAKRWVRMLKHGFHPAHFYYYHPEVEGAFIEKGGGVVARSVVINDGNNKYYTRVYATNSAIAAKLTEALCEQGVRQYKENEISSLSRFSEDQGYETQAESFEVPAFIRDNNVFCPFPWLDWLKNCWNVSYDQPKQVFVFKKVTDPKEINIKVRTHAGFLTPHMLNNSRCEHCRALIDDPIITDDGHVFCARGCYKAHGYRHIRNGEGLVLISLPNEDTIADFLYPEELYSNLQAATRNRLMPYVDLESMDEDETGCLTKHGRSVVLDGKTVMLNVGQWDRLINNGMYEDKNGVIHIKLEAREKFTPAKVDIVDELRLRYSDRGSEVFNG